MNVTIFGHGNPVKMTIESMKDSGIKILNIEQDFIRKGKDQVDFASFLEKNQIALNCWNDYEKKTDMIFVINYNKIIEVHKFNIPNIINLHMGLLPKYRGNNANAWAVMNNEKKVGYTLHKVTEVLDEGDVFYKFAYPVRKGETYFEAKNAINEDIRQNLSKELKEISYGNLKPVSQKGKKFVYCSKLRASDGEILDWNVKTRDILNKIYVFSKPLGTGLKFHFKDRTYTIECADKIPGYNHSIGIPGGIVYIFNNVLWVKTKDTAIALTRISLDGNIVNIKEYFKIGQRLG